MQVNMVIINLILIACIVVMVVDISGVVDSIKSGLKWVLTKGKMNNSDYRLKPFDCSFCMNFWSGIIYLLVIGEFTFNYVAFVLLLSCFTGNIKDAILLVKDIFTTINNWIYNKWID